MIRLFYLLTRFDVCPDRLAKLFAESVEFDDEIEQARLLIIEALLRSALHLWRREDMEASMIVGATVGMFHNAANVARRGKN